MALNDGPSCKFTPEGHFNLKSPHKLKAVIFEKQGKYYGISPPPAAPLSHRNQMALFAPFKRRFTLPFLLSRFHMVVCQFRSDAALEAIHKASENKTPNLVLYNYPSFSGAYGALFAHLYHSRLNLPCLILPFSAVAPFRYCMCVRVCIFSFSRHYVICYYAHSADDLLQNLCGNSRSATIYHIGGNNILNSYFLPC